MAVGGGEDRKGDWRSREARQLKPSTTPNPRPGQATWEEQDNWMEFYRERLRASEPEYAQMEALYASGVHASGPNAGQAGWTNPPTSASSPGPEVRQQYGDGQYGGRFLVDARSPGSPPLAGG